VTAALWPPYRGAADLEAIEAVPLEERGLPVSVFEIVRAAGQESPDETAHLTLVDGEHWQDPVRRTHGELLAEVTSRANALAALGVDRGDTVAILSVNTAELVPTLLAAETVGIAVPLNPALAVDDLAALLRVAGARVLVAAGPELHPEVWSLARHLAQRAGLTALLALRPTGAQGVPPALEPVEGTLVGHLGELAAAQPATELTFPPPSADDLAAFFHTGGTTGTPKLAAHTHAMQVADAWMVALGSSVTPGTSTFAALPLFHVNALIVTTLAPLLRRQPVVWAGPLGYRDVSLLQAFWRIVERYRVAAMSAVPTVYGALTGVPVDADITSLHLVIVGAAPLPRTVVERWRAHTGVPLCEGYGLTEGTCASSRSFPDEQRTGSVGQRLPYQQVAAVRTEEDGSWTFLPPGEVGTVVIRGPVVFPGYVTGHDGERFAIDPGTKVRDGWLDTGDLGSVSADGWLSLVGRAKDVIIRGGHNIDPLPVEHVLLQHPAVADAGVVGRPDPHAGELPVAYVVLRDAGAHADVGEEIRAWAAERVPERAAAPVAVTALPMLPVTTIGKPDKLTLRVMATAATLGPALADAGVVLSDGWCASRNGTVTVRLAPPADVDAVRRTEALLADYAIAWEWVATDPVAAPA
jgi:fatty-acyl-CoA synthase